MTKEEEKKLSNRMVSNRMSRDIECINCGEWLNRRQEKCPRCEYLNDEYYKPAKIEFFVKKLLFAW